MSKVAKKPELTNVSVKVKAHSRGYYDGRIVNEGEVFVYNGPINQNTIESNEGLPLWVDCSEGFKAPKLKEVKAPQAPQAPVAPQAPTANDLV